MPDPLLGLTLQSFLPPAQPYAVSSAFPLVAFQTAFRVFLRARIRHPIQLFKLKSSAQLSWAFSPPGLSHSPRWPGLHRSSPHAVHLFRRKRL